jgi:zinc protease
MSLAPAFELRRLANGLEVVLHRDAGAPVVAVDLWYRVGSKDERPDATGLAHLFEHLMFQGSPRYPVDYIAALQQLGAEVNGGTTYDRTGYHEVVPRNALDTALAMEADRMGGLLDALSDAKLSTQKDVVFNEFRQNYLNRPFGMTWQWIGEALYPAGHPYSWMTIGRPEHVERADRRQAAEFFRTWYVPDNACLVLAGDIDPDDAFARVEQRFGDIPAGAVARTPPTVDRLPPLERPDGRPIVRTDRVSLPRLHLVWHTVPVMAADDAELDVLAEVLAHGKTSRLHQSLVHEKQIAQSASADHWSRLLAGLFYIAVTAKPGVSPDALRDAVDAELDRLRRDPPTEREMQRSWNQREAGAVYSLQSVFGKADRFNQYRLNAGDPGYLERDLERYRRVTAADVQRVLNTYLAADRRLELRIVGENRG